MAQRAMMNPKGSETQADFSFSWYFFFSLFARSKEKKKYNPEQTRRTSVLYTAKKTTKTERTHTTSVLQNKMNKFFNLTLALS